MPWSRKSRVLASIAALVLLIVPVWYVLRGSDGRRPAPTRVRPDDPLGTDRAEPPGPTAFDSGSSTPAGPVLDRARADRIREQLRALLDAGPVRGTPEPNTPSASASAFPTMPLLPGGEIDGKYIEQRIREDFVPLARQCYADALERNPKLVEATDATIDIELVVVGDPKVGGVVDQAKLGPKTNVEDPELQTCVRESVMSVSFAAPPEGSPLTVRFPIKLSTGRTE
jgi:hypothetical protein